MGARQRARGVRLRSCDIQALDVPEYRPDDIAVFNGGDNAHRSTAVLAGLDIEAEQQCCIYTQQDCSADDSPSASNRLVGTAVRPGSIPVLIGGNMLDLRSPSGHARYCASRQLEVVVPPAAGATESTHGYRRRLRRPGMVSLLLLPLAAVPVSAGLPPGSCPEPVSAESMMPVLDPDSKTANKLGAARILANADTQSEALEQIHALLLEAVTQAERDYGETDLRMAVPLVEIGNFYFNLARGENGRRAHSRAAEILMQHGENGRLAATAPLVAIARYQLRSSRMTSKSFSQFEEILAIFDAHPCPDSQEHFTAVRDLGDAYTIGNKSARAAAVYRRAWEMQVNIGGRAAAERAFSTPKQLRMRPPLSAGGRPPMDTRRDLPPLPRARIHRYGGGTRNGPDRARVRCA